MAKTSGFASRTVIIILGIIIVILLSGMSVLYLSYRGALSVKMSVGGGPGGQQEKQLSLPVGPPPTPTPTKLNPDQGNAGNFHISEAPGTPGPKTTLLTLDPLDPKVGDKQTITAHIVYSQPITSATVAYTSDHKQRSIPLTLVSGTNTSGNWQASWTVDDTVLYTYDVLVTAKGNDGTSDTTGAEPR